MEGKAPSLHVSVCLGLREEGGGWVHRNESAGMCAWILLGWENGDVWLAVSQGRTGDTERLWNVCVKPRVFGVETASRRRCGCVSVWGRGGDALTNLTKKLHSTPELTIYSIPTLLELHSEETATNGKHC